VLLLLPLQKANPILKTLLVYEVRHFKYDHAELERIQF